MTGPDVRDFRVVHGAPDEIELAALVVVLEAVLSPVRPGGTTTAVTRGRPPLWASRSRQVRPALHAAPGAWRASTLPR